MAAATERTSDPHPAPLPEQGRENDRPAVSVVIPTRNRSALLREVVESIWRQTFDLRRCEIVIVDNVSMDDTPEVVRRMQAESPCPIVYHRMAENLGPSHSRNQGVELARAEIIAFTDSDCRAHPEWLERGTAAMTDDVAFATGSVLDKPGQPVKFFSRTNSGVTEEHPSYPTCNSMYRKRVFVEAGGFDVNLCYRDVFNRAAECADTDLAWRIKEKGGKNVFVREMIVYHEVEKQDPWSWMGEPFRLFVVPALVKRHPRLREKLLRKRLFFSKECERFYLAILGAAGAIAVHWAFAVLAVPYIWWAGTAGVRSLTLAQWLKLPARLVLLTIRQGFMSAGLIYGSVRFRSLVL